MSVSEFSADAVKEKMVPIEQTSFSTLADHNIDVKVVPDDPTLVPRFTGSLTDRVITTFKNRHGGVPMTESQPVDPHPGEVFSYADLERLPDSTNWQALMNTVSAAPTICEKAIILRHMPSWRLPENRVYYASPLFHLLYPQILTTDEWMEFPYNQYKNKDAVKSDRRWIGADYREVTMAALTAGCTELDELICKRIDEITITLGCGDRFCIPGDHKLNYGLFCEPEAETVRSTKLKRRVVFNGLPQTGPAILPNRLNIPVRSIDMIGVHFTDALPEYVKVTDEEGRLMNIPPTGLRYLIHYLSYRVHGYHLVIM